MRWIAVRQLLLLLNVTLMLSLTGCGGQSLANGGLKTALSGKANTEKTFSITTTEFSYALMVQAAGNENVSLQLRNKDGLTVGQCAEAATCVATNLEAGKYTVKLLGSAAYSDVSLAAAWSSPTKTSLQNNSPRVLPAGNANSVGLNSFYLPVGNVPVKLQMAGVESANIDLEVLDLNGTQVSHCSSSAECLVSGLQVGAYFVRHTASAAYTDASMKVSWGGADSATMENGVPKTNLSGDENTVIWQSFYIPANTSAFMVQGSQADNIEVEVSDNEGHVIAYCDSYHPCTALNPSEGLYAVAIHFHSFVSSMSLVASWAGPGNSLMVNGVAKSGLSGETKQQLLQPLYVPAGTDRLAVQLSGLGMGYAEVLDSSGYPVRACDNYTPCVLSNPVSGAYFVRVRFEQAQFGVSLAAAWAGPTISTLSNGIAKSELSGAEQQQLLQSLYVPAGTERLAVQLSGLDRGFAEVLDSNGNPVRPCDSYNPCVVSNPIPGVYFVRVRFDQAQSGVNLAAAWAGPAISTLFNGIAKSGLSGAAQQQLLQSLYVPAGTERLAVQLSGLDRGYAEVLDSNGNPVRPCDSYNPCVVSNPIPGVYFVRVRFDQAQSGVNLAAAWAGPAIWTLSNGVTKSGLSGAANQQLLQSVYIPAGVTQMTVQLTGLTQGVVEILDTNGNPMMACNAYSPCIVNIPSPGVQFVRLRFDQAQSNVGILVSW